MFFLCNLGALTAARNPFDSDRYDWTVEEARQFDDFPLYWLGDEYDGLPLTRTYKLRSPAIPDTVGFVYGEEYPPSGRSSRTAPIWIRIDPICRPSSYVTGPPTMEIRGAPAKSTGAGETSTAVTILTGAASITIDAEGRSAIKVAADLIPIAEESGAPLEPLPLPTSSC
jgi:hypothetical protein